MKTPEIFKGALAGLLDIVPVGLASSVAVENLEADGGSSFTLKINGSTEAWTFAPGDKLGFRIKNEIRKLTLEPVSGTPNYQLLVH
jgi:hypothetical protein